MTGIPEFVNNGSDLDEFAEGLVGVVAEAMGGGGVVGEYLSDTMHSVKQGLEAYAAEEAGQPQGRVQAQTLRNLGALTGLLGIDHPSAFDGPRDL